MLHIQTLNKTLAGVTLTSPLTDWFGFIFISTPTTNLLYVALTLFETSGDRNIWALAPES